MTGPCLFALPAYSDELGEEWGIVLVDVGHEHYSFSMVVTGEFLSGKMSRSGYLDADEKKL